MKSQRPQSCQMRRQVKVVRVDDQIVLRCRLRHSIASIPEGDILMRRNNADKVK